MFHNEGGSAECCSWPLAGAPGAEGPCWSRQAKHDIACNEAISSLWRYFCACFTSFMFFYIWFLLFPARWVPRGWTWRPWWPGWNLSNRPGYQNVMILEEISKFPSSGHFRNGQAVFVATLEHLLHGDERERLKQSWSVHDLKQEELWELSTFFLRFFKVCFSTCLLRMEDLTDAEGLQSVLEPWIGKFFS